LERKPSFAVAVGGDDSKQWQRRSYNLDGQMTLKIWRKFVQFGKNFLRNKSKSWYHGIDVVFLVFFYYC
jgi:hypothetical protein